MSKFKKVLAVALVALCAASVASAAMVGNFKVKSSEGKDVTQDMLKGKPTMLVISNTACGQCRVEMGELDKSLDAIKAKGNVWVVMVDANAERAVELYGKLGFKAPLLLDPDFTIANSLDLSATPSTVILDKDLNVVFSKTGYRPGNMKELIEKM